jgi:hypothetical protein
MLRSIIIGFAVATLLQVGGRTTSPAPDLAVVAQDLNRAQLQHDGVAFVRLIAEGYTTLMR